MDVVAVYQAIAYAREWAIASRKGPLVLEMDTYRYGGHSMSDPGTTYRSREEIQKVRLKSDPIGSLKDRLLEHKVATEDEIKMMDKAARAEVDKAVEQATNDLEPPAEWFWDNVYVKDTEVPVLRGCDPEDMHYYRQKKAA